MPAVGPRPTGLDTGGLNSIRQRRVLSKETRSGFPAERGPRNNTAAPPQGRSQGAKAWSGVEPGSVRGRARDWSVGNQVWSGVKLGSGLVREAGVWSGVEPGTGQWGTRGRG